MAGIFSEVFLSCIDLENNSWTKPDYKNKKLHYDMELFVFYLKNQARCAEASIIIKHLPYKQERVQVASVLHDGEV